MDDFGGSAVWGDATPSLSFTPINRTTNQTAPVPTSLFATPKEDPFDEFAEFDNNNPLVATQSAADDDFGDFGDFAADVTAPQDHGHFDEDSFGFAENTSYGVEMKRALIPLRLHPLPDSSELSEQVGELLLDLVQGPQVDQVLSGEGIRQIDNPVQLLVSHESRSLYRTLFEDAAPSLRAPNWTRSKIRRNHLITLGIPVNLDEVNPHANGRALPTLNIITRPSSTPPRTGSRQPSRVGTPVQPAQSARYKSAASTTIQNLGPKPEVDHDKIATLLDLDPDNLPLLPIPKLEANNSAIRSQIAAASNLLSYLLQCREALQQDSDIFNKKIAEMVSEAQRMKSGSRKLPVKRGSGMN